jgi:DNA-directed RNA polymerase specialized sigma subunit
MDQQQVERRNAIVRILRSGSVRKQTDLVLDKLADQLNRKKVDKELLKELGWSEADMKRFVERWQQRKAAADKSDPSGEAAKRELDEALRSLGLRPGTMQQNTAKKDTLRDLREGYHGPVPSAYQERLRAYNQGVSRARQEDE